MTRRFFKTPAALAFWICGALIATTFLIGGGARPDIVTLPLLRFLAGLACAFAALTAAPEQLRRHRLALILAAVVVGFIALQLVPLPPGLWHALPGRSAIAESDALAGLTGLWRPFSLTPGDTWNALFSLLVPLGVFLLGLELSRAELERLVFVVVALGGLSAFVGVMQVIGEAGGAFYFYRITNPNSAVGLFSNRNHHAIFLAALFPMLAFVATRPALTVEKARIRGWLCALGAIALIPVILVAGSRAGVVLALVALIGAAMLYRAPAIAKTVRRGDPRFDWRAPLLALAMLVIGVLTFVVSRAEAIVRLIDSGSDEELRIQVWGPILRLGWDYFPWGSGIGSFVQTYRMDEPDRLLDATYLNHAHNELLEIWLTGGAPGMALLAIVLVVLLIAMFDASRAMVRREPGSALPGLGAVTLAILFLGSIADYPLRTPSLAALFAIALLWLRPPRRQAGRNG